jgi:hypothetical protein
MFYLDGLTTFRTFKFNRLEKTSFSTLGDVKLATLMPGAYFTRISL